MKPRHIFHPPDRHAHCHRAKPPNPSRHGVAALLVLLCANLAVGAATVTWTGATGNRLWTDPKNWSSGVVPDAKDDVVIGPRAGIVEIREGTHSILRLNATDGLLITGGTLVLSEGESRVGGSFILAPQAKLIVRGPDTTLLATGEPVEWGGDISVESGAIARLPAVVGIRTGGSGLACTWSATGPGSMIDASNVGEVFMTGRGLVSINAQNKSIVDLRGVKVLRGSIHITATRDAVVDLTGPSGRWTSEGFTYQQALSATSGGRILIPGITEFDRGILEMDSPEALPTRQLVAVTRSAVRVSGFRADFNALTNLDDCDLTVSAGGVVSLPRVTTIRNEACTWHVRDPDSRIEAPALGEIHLASTGYFDLTASANGTIDLPAITRLEGSIRILAEGGGSVNIERARGTWTSEGFTYQHALTTRKGGAIRIAGITGHDRGQLDTDSPDGIPTAQITTLTRSSLTTRGAKLDLAALTNIDDTHLSALEGGVLALPAVRQLRSTGHLWRARDRGSLIDASTITEWVCPANGYFDISAEAGGRIDLSGLPSLRGPIFITASGLGEINLTGVRGRWTSEGFTYRQSLDVRQGGRILLPGLTEFDRGTIDTDSADGIGASQLSVLTRSSFTLRGATPSLQSLTNIDDTTFSVYAGGILRLPSISEVRSMGATWHAQDPGSLIDFSTLKQLQIGRNGYHDVHADVAGRIDLSGLGSIDGPLRVTARSGGIVDLSGLSGRWSSSGYTYRQGLFASGDGRILVPGITEFDRGQIDVGPRGFVSTEQLTSLTESSVTIDQATLTFARLRDQTGTTFTLRNGGLALFASFPRIITPPVDRRGRIGDSIELSVIAEGDPPLRYQWRKNGQNLPGAVSAILRLDELSIDDAGSYSVVVLNPAGVVQSEPASVTVELPSLPFADNFAARGRITAESGAGIASNANATLEPGEPRHAEKRGGRSVWLTWRAPASGRATFSTVGSAFDTLLAVYSGDVIDRLTPIASDEDSAGFLAARVAFNVTSGVDYQIVVDGYAGAGGDLILSWNLERGVAPYPEIVTPPVGGTVTAGGDLTLAVDARGENLTYQWFFRGEPIRGETGPTLVLRGGNPAQAGIYSVRVSNPAGQIVESKVALVEVVSEPAAARAEDKRQDLFPDPLPGRAVLHGMQGSGFTPVFPGIPGSRDTGNTGASRSPDDPIILGELGGASIWLRFQAIADGWMHLSTEGSAIPTVLGVYTNLTELHEIALAIPVPPATHSEVLFGARAGEDYLVMIDGVDGVRGKITLTYSLNLAPVDTARLTLDGANVLLQLPVPPGQYEIAVGPEITGVSPVLTTNVFGGLLQFLDNGGAGSPRRFYRINGVAQ